MIPGVCGRPVALRGGGYRDGCRAPGFFFCFFEEGLGGFLDLNLSGPTGANRWFGAFRLLRLFQVLIAVQLSLSFVPA